MNSNFSGSRSTEKSRTTAKKGREETQQTAVLILDEESDFSTVYLCELEIEKLAVRKKCELHLFSNWQLRDDVLIIEEHGKNRKITLTR